MSIRAVANRAGITALLTAAWALLMMRATNQYPFPHVFHHDVNSPVLALEISRDAGDIDGVLHRSHPEMYLFSVGLEFVDELNRREVSKALHGAFRSHDKALIMKTDDRPPMRVEVEQAGNKWRIFDALTNYSIRNEDRTLNVYHLADAAKSMSQVNLLDLGFIPLYTFAIWSLARVFTTRTRWLALGILAAALFDYIEDWEIYRAIAGESPAIYVPSLIKWALLGLVFIALSRIMIQSDSPVYSLPTKRILAIVYFASGVLILLDVVLGQWIGYSHIELGMALFALLTAINVIGLLGHYFAIPGIQPVYVENFCEERKKARDGSMTAVKGERTD